MADYDTFPINLPADHILPNNGKFTGHAKYIPNLVSGSASEWNRMVGLLFHAFSRHNHKANTEFYSDMYANKYLYYNNASFTGSSRTAQLDEFYVDEIANPSTRWHLIDPYDFTNKCQLSNNYTAVHFSHYACNRMWFCRDGSHKDVNGNPQKRLRRSEVAREWLESWKIQCSNKKI